MGKSRLEMSNMADFLTDDEIVSLIKNSPEGMNAVQEYIGKEEESDSDSYPEDPIEFIEQVLGYTLWEKQKDVARSIESFPNTVVESGKGIGKSLISAAIACWWMTIKPEAVVVILAPSHAHVNNVLWAYIRKLGRKAELPGEILDTPRWKFGDGRFAVGLSPRKGKAEDLTSLYGYHSPNLLVIMDEASGLNKLVWEAVSGLVTSENNRTLAIGNPIASSGPFFEACQSPNWNYIHVNTLKSPNVVAKEEVIPGLTSYRWVKDKIRDHCMETDPNAPGSFCFEDVWYIPDAYFQTQVLGVAPSESDDQLISLEWIRTAQINKIDPLSSPPVLGLDPSRGGDDATMGARKGMKVLWVKRKKPVTKNPSRELAGWLAEEAKKLKAVQVYIDAIGIGAGVADEARELGLPVYDAKFSYAARQGKRFANLRAECYWILRELLQQELLDIPDDDLLEADLLEQKYKYDTLGRILLEDKRKIRKRLGRSPDTSDSIALTFALGDTFDGVFMGAKNVDETRREGGSIWQLGGKSRTRYQSSRWRRFSKK